MIVTDNTRQGLINIHRAGVTYDCHYDDCNSFIIQATGVRGYGLDLNPRPWADEEYSTTVLLLLTTG